MKMDNIKERLLTQDNLGTANPMFCVQIKVRDTGYDAAYSEQLCWHDSANGDWIYDDDEEFTKPPSGTEWDEFGYVDRWETVMVALTHRGAEEYLEQNGHNDRRRAFRGEVRIYVDSFNRCPEMIAIREALMSVELAVSVNSSGIGLTPASQRRVVSAAMLMDDGLVVPGVRHFSDDMRAVMHRIYGDGYHLRVKEQGFIDTHGGFLTRKEAWVRASDNGQIRKSVAPDGELYSENLY